MKEARIFLAIICLIYMQCGIVSVQAANSSVLYKKSTLASIQKSGKTKIRPLYATRVRTLRVASTPVAPMATPGVPVPASTTPTPVIDTTAPVYAYTTPTYTAPTPTVTTPTPSTPVETTPVTPTPTTPTPTVPTTPTPSTPVVPTPVTPTPTVPVTPPLASTPPTPVVVSRSAKITYRTPGGDDDMTFSVTSTDGVITSATSVVEALNRESIKYQQRFASAMPSIVIGKKISGFSISTIGGASLTTNAFKKFIASNF